ncbi:MAG: dihydroneopterin aldolase [Bacteroidia bacterium]|nr:dihydroneopterin aldolase [Bacteroidia bacterium]
MIVELKDILIYAYHGLYDFERVKGGEFIVDVRIETEDKISYTELQSVINYEEIYAIVKYRMGIAQLFIEEVARLIKEDILEKYPESKHIEVKLTKCAPPMEGFTGKACVTSAYTR